MGLLNGAAGYFRIVSSSTLALITVPFVMGVIGYLTNWTGVLMLFYPVHFRGLRAPWIRTMARLLPYKHSVHLAIGLIPSRMPPRVSCGRS